MKADERFNAHAFAELQAVVKLWPEEDRIYCTDANLLRFLLARGSVTDSAKQLHESITWRRSHLVAPFVCRMCVKDHTSHNFIPIGWESTEQSTIVYGAPARASNTEVDPCVDHVASQLEYCFAHPKSGPRWVWLVDYNGFGWTHAMQGSLAIRFATLFSAQMPERLHKILLVNPPTVFRMLLGAVTPFVDKRTMSKVISLVGSHEEILVQLRDHHAFPESTLSWFEKVLVTEATPGKLPPPPPESHTLFIDGMESYLTGVPQTAAKAQ